jgi:hypothetical protein
VKGSSSRGRRSFLGAADEDEFLGNGSLARLMTTDRQRQSDESVKPLQRPLVLGVIISSTSNGLNSFSTAAPASSSSYPARLLLKVSRTRHSRRWAVRRWCAPTVAVIVKRDVVRGCDGHLDAGGFSHGNYLLRSGTILEWTFETESYWEDTGGGCESTKSHVTRTN